MGCIKDGTVSGFLPSRKAFSINYPGYPSISRAIETLGGSSAISEARSSQSNKLALYFRPEDPYSHPVFGELQPCNNFLLRLSREQSNVVENELYVSQHENMMGVGCRKVEIKNPKEVQGDLSVEIVARVSEAYHFTGMVDYQHIIPVHANVSRREKRSWVEMESNSGKGDLADLYHEDLMILLPPLFSLKDLPEEVVLKPANTLSSKKKRLGGAKHWAMNIDPCQAIDFSIEEIPKKISWENYILKNSNHWQWQLAVIKLFDERPIWIKESLVEHLHDQGVKIGDYLIRRMLFRAAYYFSNGPFHRFWIRKGYDPRKDSNSRIYQRIDFRVPIQLRNYCEINTSKGHRNSWKQMCEFQSFPYKCQTAFQLVELSDDYIQEEIRKPVKQTTCTRETGWFFFHELNTFRFRVAVRFLSIYPEGGADKFIKSTSVRFEKSKKIAFHKINSRLNEANQLGNSSLSVLHP